MWLGRTGRMRGGFLLDSRGRCGCVGGRCDRGLLCVLGGVGLAFVSSVTGALVYDRSKVSTRRMDATDVPNKARRAASGEKTPTLICYACSAHRTFPWESKSGQLRFIVGGKKANTHPNSASSSCDR